MFLESIDIANFRGIRQLSLRLEQTTVIIGENNTGKSTILDALLLALGSAFAADRRTFVKDDHHLAGSDVQIADGDTIEIVLRFVERSPGEWPMDTIQQIYDVVHIDDSGKRRVTMRVQSTYNSSTSESSTEWSFLNPKHEKLPTNGPQRRRTLQSLIPLFPLHSTRDWGQESRHNSRFWGPFVRSLTMSDDMRQDLEKELADINKKIVDIHEPFGAVKDQLNRISKLVPLSGANPVNIDAFPASLRDVLSRTKVSLASITGAKIPIERHGEGTQNIAIICLFLAYLRSKIDEQYNMASPILTIEEPEAHLHPSAAYSVTSLLDNPRGQNIIATHSGDLVANVATSSLKFLRRRKGEIVIRQIDDSVFEPKDKLAIDYHVQNTRGNILFARCWLLVEGETDRLVFEQCASVHGIDLTFNGIYCVEYAQMGSPRPLIKLAKQIGIEWFVVADGDDWGHKYVKAASKDLNGEDSRERIHQLEHPLEVVLCLQGYGDHYERAACTESQNKNGDAAYWKKVMSIIKKQDKKAHSKPYIATLVMQDMRKAGKDGVPEAIRQIIDKSIQLAGG